MLVLTRKLNEKITIGDDIELTVVAIGNGRVRIGITAPADVPIGRPDAKTQVPKTPVPRTGRPLPAPGG